MIGNLRGCERQYDKHQHKQKEIPEGWCLTL